MPELMTSHLCLLDSDIAQRLLASRIPASFAEFANRCVGVAEPSDGLEPSPPPYQPGDLPVVHRFASAVVGR